MFKAFALACAAACVAAPAFAASLQTTYVDDTDDINIVFDIQIGAADITITQLVASFVGTLDVVHTYYVLGGYAATPTLSSWTLWDSSVPIDVGIYAMWDVADQVFAAGQTYGVYLQTDGDGFSFGEDGGAGSVLASNTDLTILQGGSDGLPPIAPGAWNGVIVYDVVAPPPADVPLPAALPLALVGFGALVALGRRRA